jgi:ATP-binding cassette subfamily B multidrug efflux pump
VNTGLTLLGPYLLGVAIDDADCRAIWLGWRASAAHAGRLRAEFAADLAQPTSWSGVAQRTVRDLRNDLFARLQALPLRFFDQPPRTAT